MGLWGKIKGFVNDVVDAVLKAVILNPLIAVLEAVGFYTFIAWIEKIVQFILDVLNFLLDLIGILFDLVEFGIKFIEVLFKICTKLGYYASRPFEFITLLLNLGFTLATFVFAFAYHKFSFRNNLKVAEFFLYCLIAIPVTVVFIVAVAFWTIWKLFVEYVILRSIDKSSKGYISSFIYRYFLACENPPDNWYMLPGAHLGNASAKNVFAYNPCPKGSNFRGSKYSMFCEKDGRYDMSMCQEANLYRTHLKMDHIGSLQNSKLIVDKAFMKLSSVKKQKFIEEYESAVNRNINSCRDFNKDKSNLLKSICMKYSDDDVSLKNKSTLNKLCYELYCSRGREGFCHKFNHSGRHNQDNLAQQKTLSLLVNLIIAILLIMLIVRRQAS